MALALARGFDRFMVDTKQGQWRRENSARMQTLTGKTMLVVGLGGIGTEVASRAHGLGMKVTATRNSGRTVRTTSAMSVWLTSCRSWRERRM